MPGLFNFNFGGQKVDLPSTSPEQQRFLHETILPGIMDALGRASSGELLEDFPGTTAGTDQALLEVERLLSSAAPGRESMTQANRLLQEIMGRGPTDIEDFIRSSVIAPAERYTYEEALPQARARGAGMGSLFGGGQDVGESRIISDYMRDINAIRGATALEGRYRDTDVAMRAAELASGMPGRELGFLTGAAGALDAPRQIDMDAILAALDQEFRLMQLGGSVGTTATRNTAYVPGATDLLSQEFGSALGSILGEGAGQAVGTVAGGLFNWATGGGGYPEMGGLK